MRSIPLDEVARRFNYNPATGELSYKIKVRGSCRSIGDKVGAVDSRGYLQVKINGVFFLVHRICYAIHTGLSDFGEIDHVDTNRLNNCISNLRLATRKENNTNTSYRKSNKLLVRNVTEDRGKFRVDICGKYYGSFFSLRNAVAFANKIRRDIGGEFAYIQDELSVPDIDNTPEFSISGVLSRNFKEILSMTASEAMLTYNISKSSYYRIREHIIRMQENGTPVPQDILDAREAARASVVEI